MSMTRLTVQHTCFDYTQSNKRTMISVSNRLLVQTLHTTQHAHKPSFYDRIPCSTSQR